MKKFFKRIMACTLAGVIVAGSCGSYSQVNAKNVDIDSIESAMLNDRGLETSYIIDCKNPIIYNMINKNYAEDKKEDIYLQDNNIVSLELTGNELENIKSAGVVVEEDYILTGSSRKKPVNNRLQGNNVKHGGNEKKDNLKNNKVKNYNRKNWSIGAVGVDENTDNLNRVLQNTKEVSQNKVKIAIIDSGVDFSEYVNVVARKNFVGDDINPVFEDSTGHGTAIASIIGSNGNNDATPGINPNAEIYSARVLDENNQAPVSRICEAIYWAIENKVNIINISFGTDKDSEILHKAIRDASKAGILIFAASGNGGNDSAVEYPAAYSEVVAVGATAPTGELSDMTSCGEELELLAPGEAIETTGFLDIDIVSSGTSMAVPHAVGVASLLWEKDLSKSAEFIRSLMEASAKEVLTDNDDYSFVDYEYANEIYDDYYDDFKKTQYSYNSVDVDEINEEYDNQEDVEDYSEVATGSWSKDNHVKTVTYAEGEVNCLNASELNILKKSVKLPDIEPSWHCAWESNTRIFHGKYDTNSNYNYNYVEAYKVVMTMSKKCKNGKKVAVAIDGAPNTTEGNVIKALMNDNKKCITSHANSNKRNASIVFMGIAMHMVADTYAHSAAVYIKKDKTFIPVRDISDMENDTIKDCPARFECAKKSCKKILNVWKNNSNPSSSEYNVSGFGNNEARKAFRLRFLYTYSNDSNLKNKSIEQ